MKNSLINEIRLPSGWELKNLKDMTCSFKSGFLLLQKIFPKIQPYSLFMVVMDYVVIPSTFTHDSAYTLIGRQGALCGNLKLC